MPQPARTDPYQPVLSVVNWTCLAQLIRSLPVASMVSRHASLHMPQQAPYDRFGATTEAHKPTSNIAQLFDVGYCLLSLCKYLDNTKSRDLSLK